MLWRLIEKQCHSDIITELDGWFRISADSKMCYLGNINSLILLKFGTNIPKNISNKIENFC